MKIIEVRDGFIKFEADSSVFLSSFIKIEGMEKSYVAQVNQLKHIGTISIATAKILFLFNGTELFNYDKTEPSKDSDIAPFPLDVLMSSLNLKNPIVIGKSIDSKKNIAIDSSAFDKKMLISIDNADINNTVIQNLSKQFAHMGKRTVIVDSLGIMKTPKYIAGNDFKLPLNTSTLDFIYESCLNDATDDSKATIVEIFKELAEYSKTVPFLPFQALKSIVDEMVDKQHIFKLLVLKNKLAKFEKLGYFAISQKEIPVFDKMFSANTAVVDISILEPVFQNKYLSFIYENVASYNDIQVLFIVSNTTSKKNLKKILSSDISTTFVTHSKFQYLNDIKNLFDNFIITPSISNNELFKVYSSFLTSMDRSMYLMAGEALNYIPLVSEVQDINDYAEQKTEVTEAKANNELLEDLLSDKEQVQDADVLPDIQDDSLEENEDDVTENDAETIELNSDDGIQPHEEIENNEDSEDNVITSEQGLVPPFGENVLSEEEIIASIDEHSQNAINEVASNIESASDINVFSEDNDEDENNQNKILEDDSNNMNQDNSVQDIIDAEYTETISEDADSVSEQEVEEQNISGTEDEFDNPELSILTENNDEIHLETDDADSFSNEIPDGSISVDEDSSFAEESLSDVSENIEQTDDISESNNENEELIIEDDNLEEVLPVSDEVNDISLEEQEINADGTGLPEISLDADFSESKVIPLDNDDTITDDFDEIVELDQDLSDDSDIIVDMEDDSNVDIDENIDQQIKEDVDKVYTTIKEDNGIEEISDSDLDLIDELNSDEELEEYNGEELHEISDSDVDNDILEDFISEESGLSNQNDTSEILEKRDSTTPIVPVYDADIPQEDMVVSDPIQQGDAVMHAKYGNGVVEKMIKYGNKTLFAINFENIGRRLLDPTLTEIKKV